MPDEEKTYKFIPESPFSKSIRKIANEANNTYLRERNNVRRKRAEFKNNPLVLVTKDVVEGKGAGVYLFFPENEKINQRPVVGFEAENKQDKQVLYLGNIESSQNPREISEKFGPLVRNLTKNIPKELPWTNKESKQFSKTKHILLNYVSESLVSHSLSAFTVAGAALANAYINGWNMDGATLAQIAATGLAVGAAIPVFSKALTSAIKSEFNQKAEAKDMDIYMPAADGLKLTKSRTSRVSPEAIRRNEEYENYFRHGETAIA